MKKIASILVLVFVFTLTVEAQKKRDQNSVKLSVEQQADLAVKKMTLALNLSEKQQKQILPLVKAQAENRAVAMTKRKELRDKEVKPTADEVYAMRSKQLENSIAFKNNMKDILNKDQFVKFEESSKKRMKRGKDMMKRKGMKRAKTDNSEE